MSHALLLTASARSDGSVSRALVDTWRTAWLAGRPGSTLTERDLAANPVPHLSPELLAARFGGSLPGSDAAVAIQEELIAEVEAADTVVISSPMYNWSIPSTLKAWFDHVIVSGRTANVADGPGLLAGKTVALVLAQGGGYGEGTPRHSWDHQEPYLRLLLEALGAEDLTVVKAELTMADVNPAMAELRDIAKLSLSTAHEHATSHAAQAA